MGSLLHNLQVTVKPCDSLDDPERQEDFDIFGLPPNYYAKYEDCLLYTSDAADE